MTKAGRSLEPGSAPEWHDILFKLVNRFMTSLQHGSIEILCDLQRINDEHAGYYDRVIAAGDLQGRELPEFYISRANKCRKNAELLRDRVFAAIGVFSNELVKEGEIYSKWKNSKSSFRFRDQTAVLADCELREEAMMEAYQEALISPLLQFSNGRELVMDQKFALQGAQQSIRKNIDLARLHFVPAPQAIDLPLSKNTA